MKDVRINQKVYDLVLQLLDKYIDDYVPPVDYLKFHETYVMHKVQVEEDYEFVVELFLSVIKHRQFLIDIVNYFYCLGKRRDRSDQNRLIILSYLIINQLKHSNKNDIIGILKGENVKTVVNLFKFFNKTSIDEKLLQAGCQYFEDEYVIREIISKLTENKDLLKEVSGLFEQDGITKGDRRQTKITIPKSPRLSVSLRPPPQPPNTPQIQSAMFEAKPFPASTYAEPKESVALVAIRQENKKASLKLLETAKGISRNVQRKHHTCPKDEPKPFVRNRLVVKENVPVKKNAATILREASRLIKEEEKEIIRVNELVCGGVDLTKYEDFLEQLRASEEQEKLEDIERKHLRGLLTREEAILARQTLLKTNKAKKTQFDLEKKETEDALKKIREKHNDKIREMIEKTQQVQKNIAEQKKKMILQKQKSAQEVAETKRQMFEEFMLRQKEELEKKIEIIREIKALSSIKDLDTNRFDPTETMNLGLFCEMSLTELQERLLINRIRVKEEIENRQKCLRNQRQKQQQFLSDTEEFINNCRQQRKMATIMDIKRREANKITKESNDIKELREKLQKARQKRIEHKINR